ncbi:MAG: YigZ family protein [Pseudoflavonifractor sp.]|nr:YigZ family protein [Alloprevotella sp.]MCM1115990.1 YigZ family protein [Pseudoflavonifractor sp.]
MSSAYVTIAEPARGRLTVKMSRFLAFAFPVTTPEEARERIAEVAADYHDARHCCWAWRLGAEGTDTASSDNGEPSGTAGKPILNQIRSSGLTNVAVAVVRYFGGIKLGVPGLIAAYKEATDIVLSEAVRVERCEETIVSLTFPYMAMNDVMRIVKSTPEAAVAGQDFDNTCTLRLRIRADHAAALAERLAAVDGSSVTPL